MICVVVPAYNEKKQIGRVIRGLFEHGFTDVVVVDDGSLDNTAGEAGAAGAVVVRHEINRGQGAALQTGDEYALKKGAEITVHFDGDGQFNPADIGGAVEKMKKDSLDVIFGSRFLDGRSKIPCLKKYFILPAAKLVNWIFTGVKLTDAHNGFRVLSRAALEKIHITQDRMAHNSEIVRQVKKNNLKWAEYPVEVKYFKYGQGIVGGIRIVWDLVVSNF